MHDLVEEWMDRLCKEEYAAVKYDSPVSNYISVRCWCKRNYWGAWPLGVLVLLVSHAVFGV